MINTEKLLNYLLLETIRHELALSVLFGQVASFMAEGDSEASIEEAIEVLKARIVEIAPQLLPIKIQAMEKDLGLSPGSISISGLGPDLEFDTWLRKHDFHFRPPDE